MAKCWAAPLGDGCDAQSREHTISQGLFLGDRVTVQGLSWCLDEPKEIPLSGLVRKILCAKHNGDLSGKADDPAIKAIRVLRACSLRYLEVNQEPNRRFPYKKHEIDGRGFERWLLKTLINVCFSYHRIGVDSESTDHVPLALVEAAFGKRTLEEPAGLYFPVRVGDDICQEEGFQVVPLHAPDDVVMGGRFLFRGFSFLLWLHPDSQPKMGGLDTTLMFRPRRINDPDCAQRITFRWKKSWKQEWIPRRRRTRR